MLLTINAEVKVISVIMTLFASAHANELTRVINSEEEKGCILFNINSYNNAAYLYFRCSKKKNK